jgi:hypothetical protein
MDERKYKKLKEVILTMMGLTEIYNEMKVLFQVNTKPL